MAELDPTDRQPWTGICGRYSRTRVSDNRHEGKLTGLSAMGEPAFADRIGQHFRVDEAGQIFSDFRNNSEIFNLLREIAKEGSREDVAASI